MLFKSRFLVAAATVAVAIISLGPVSRAAVLSGSFGSALPGSTGIAAFSSSNLAGSVQYAVFTESAYNSIFTNSTVSVGLGELAYVYQVINTGTDAVSKNRILGLNASITGIGSSDINAGGAGEVAPSSVTLPPPYADWDFSPNILSGENSSALVLTSTNLPDGTTTDIIFNGGTIGNVQVIKPGNIAIPEPASVLLLAFGSTLLLVRRRR